jgi:hypothetical protein
MRAGQVALAATVFLAYPGPGAAGSSPLIPALLGASLDSHRDIETVRWRHRHRRDDDDSDDRRPAGANRLETTDVWSSNGAIRSINTEVVRPDPRRRRGWVDPPRLNRGLHGHDTSARPGISP